MSRVPWMARGILTCLSTVSVTPSHHHLSSFGFLSQGLTAVEPKISLPPPSHCWDYWYYRSAPPAQSDCNVRFFFFFSVQGMDPEPHMLDRLSTTEPQRISIFARTCLVQ